MMMVSSANNILGRRTHASITIKRGSGCRAIRVSAEQTQLLEARRSVEGYGNEIDRGD
jgi:hypothetical protein